MGRRTGEEEESEKGRREKERGGERRGGKETGRGGEKIIGKRKGENGGKVGHSQKPSPAKEVPWAAAQWDWSPTWPDEDLPKQGRSQD